MAVGRESKTAVADPYGPELGKAGRVPVAPPGKIYVRDPAAAESEAIKEAVERFKAAGQDVPEHLVELAAKLPDGADDVIVEVDSDFPGEPGRYSEDAAEVQVAEVVAEDEISQGQAEAVEEVEAADEDEELEGFTIAELKDELDRLGVEYDAHARKAELVELVKKAEAEE